MHQTYFSRNQPQSQLRIICKQFWHSWSIREKSENPTRQEEQLQDTKIISCLSVKKKKKKKKKKRVGWLRKCDNRELGLHLQNNNFARALRIFVHFFAFPTQVVELRKTPSRRLMLPSLPEVGRGPLSSVTNYFPYFQVTGWLGMRAKKFEQTLSLFFGDLFIDVAVVGS